MFKPRPLVLVPGIKSSRARPPLVILETPGLIFVGGMLQDLFEVFVQVVECNTITEQTTYPCPFSALAWKPSRNLMSPSTFSLFIPPLGMLAKSRCGQEQVPQRILSPSYGTETAAGRAFRTEWTR